MLRSVILVSALGAACASPTPIVDDKAGDTVPPETDAYIPDTFVYGETASPFETDGSVGPDSPTPPPTPSSGTGTPNGPLPTGMLPTGLLPTGGFPGGGTSSPFGTGFPSPGTGLPVPATAPGPVAPMPFPFGSQPGALFVFP